MAWFSYRTGQGISHVSGGKLCDFVLQAMFFWVLEESVQFSAGIDVPQMVFIIVLILNSSLWLIPAGNSNSATVHEEPPQMRAPPPLMRDHPSWPGVELFMYNLVLGLCKISPNTGRSGEKDDVETC